MRSIGPLPCITLISMLTTAAVTTLILALDGSAEYVLVAVIWAASIAIHVRDLRIHQRERERERLQAIREAAAILQGDAEAQPAPAPEPLESQQRPAA
jgi:hypothetical protein